MSVEPYPFDMHRCSIDVSVASDSGLVSLEPGAEQQDLVDMPEAFEGSALMDEVEVLVNDNTPNGLMQTTVSFKMEFMRNPSFVTITYILIAFGLNLVSFGSVRPRTAMETVHMHHNCSSSSFSTSATALPILRHMTASNFVLPLPAKRSAGVHCNTSLPV